MVDRYNESKRGGGKEESYEPESKSKAGEKKQKRPKNVGGESGGEHAASQHDEMKQIHDEHGAAVSHHIHRTHQGYASTTHHEDGHVHGPVDHATLGEAHEHGGHAFGEDTEHMGDRLPEDQEISEEAENNMSQGGMGGSNVGYLG
jgi:hypothetical protein